MKKTNYLAIGLLWIMALMQISYWTVWDLTNVKEQLWDLNIYAHAADVYLKGLNPWLGTGFLYHPAFIDFLSASSPYQKEFLVALYVVMFAILIRAGNVKGHSISFLLLLSGAFCGIGVIGVFSGNVSTFFHFCLIGLSLTLNSTSGLAFYALAIVAFSFAKPFFFIFLAIPIVLALFCHRARLKVTFSIIVGALSLAAAVNAYYWVFNPGQINDFVMAIRSQVTDGEPNGFGWYKYFWKLTKDHGWAQIFYLMFALVYFYPVIYFARNLRANFFIEQILFQYFVLLMLIPRLREYDAFPGIFAALAAFFLLYKNSNKFCVIVPIYGVSLLNFQLFPFAAQRGLLGHYDGLVMIAGLLLYAAIARALYGHTLK